VKDLGGGGGECAGRLGLEVMPGWSPPKEKDLGDVFDCVQAF
jgi:hypothetical protein